MTPERFHSVSRHCMSVCFLLGVLLLVVPPPASAQDDSLECCDDSSDCYDERLWFRLRHKPTISLTYGFTTSALSGLSQTLASAPMAELKIGGTVLDTIGQTPMVLEQDYDYVFLSTITHDLGSTPPVAELKSTLWRFGFGWESGYGYDFSSPDAKMYVVGYHGTGIHWSRLSLTDPVPLPADRELLGNFDGTFRFGTKTEGGLRIKLLPLIAIDVGFERSIVFRRHLFWKWLGSAGLETGGQWLVDRFVGRVKRSSPLASPVVAFVLKNALSYGVYQLRREKMNFPFDSESPLMYDGWKVGVSFLF